MITKEAIENAASKHADGYSGRDYSQGIYNGFKQGVEWALKQVQSESLEHKS